MATLDPDSLAKLGTCEPVLANIIIAVAAHCPFGFRVTDAARTVEKQQEAFDTGHSKVNPKSFATPALLYAAAKHVTGPGAPLSRAVDVAIVGRDPYNVPQLAYLAGMIKLEAARRNVKVRWGGDFDRDGALLEPGTFQDTPHHELDQ
jgi:hypothetical protein